MLKLGDNNLIVSYLQIFLKENGFGKAPLPGDEGVYLAKELDVTGIYTWELYPCVYSYLLTMYPNEKFLEVTTPTVRETLNNVQLQSRTNKAVLDIPDRIIAYFLGSVISDLDTINTVYELQLLLVDKLGGTLSTGVIGDYDTIKPTIEQLQHWYGEPVTGYFTPTTEKALYMYTETGR